MATPFPLHDTATLNHESFEALTGLGQTKVENNVIRAEQDRASSIWHVPLKSHRQGRTLIIRLEGAEVPSWLCSVIESIEHLINLDVGWDSYGAQPIDLVVVERVIKFLDSFLDDELTVPDLVPTSEGGIQLEWDHDEKVLELDFRPNGNYVVFLQDTSKPEPRELERQYHDSYNFYLNAGRLLRDSFTS